MTTLLSTGESLAQRPSAVKIHEHRASDLEPSPPDLDPCRRHTLTRNTLKHTRLSTAASFPTAKHKNMVRVHPWHKGKYTIRYLQPVEYHRAIAVNGAPAG